jgi:anti-repressor protein
MNELIKIEARAISGAALAQTVNARDLHAFLEVASAFKDWIARKIADYGFDEGKDYCSFLSESSGGRPAREYALSLDMGKELAMVERTEKGKEARQYFLECERQAQARAAQPNLPALPQTLAEALRFAADQAEVIDEQKKALAVAVPKALVFDELHVKDGLFCIRDAASTANVFEGELINKLIEAGWCYRRENSDGTLGRLVAAHYGLDHAYLVQKPAVLRSGRVEPQVMVTVKGLHRMSALVTLGHWKLRRKSEPKPTKKRARKGEGASA